MLVFHALPGVNRIVHWTAVLHYKPEDINKNPITFSWWTSQYSYRPWRPGQHKKRCREITYLQMFSQMAQLLKYDTHQKSDRFWEAWSKIDHYGESLIIVFYVSFILFNFSSFWSFTYWRLLEYLTVLNLHK